MNPEESSSDSCFAKFQNFQFFNSSHLMAAILSGQSEKGEDGAMCSCPFCGKAGYKRLSSHLPHCPERNGCDYTSMLSENTLNNRKGGSSIHASLEVTSERPQNTCPFCEKVFKRVGNHLTHCKERRDRDYSAYLAKKTLDKRTRVTTKKACPKCHRMFTRLDTHLKHNAICKSIPYRPS